LAEICVVASTIGRTERSVQSLLLPIAATVAATVCGDDDTVYSPYCDVQVLSPQCDGASGRGADAVCNVATRDVPGARKSEQSKLLRAVGSCQQAGYQGLARHHQFPGCQSYNTVLYLYRSVADTDIADRSFRYASPRLWNQLPDSFHQPSQSSLDSPPHLLFNLSFSSSPLPASITPSLFHFRLKMYLFNKSFPP